ncbi:type I-F CRISPR-associated protein Csy2 [Hahella aquimaris]|uniref:type I-F CRISPR-associated protein Csy2 n=1 Tax=Hahella sp. HNIBRBA332 TaxID=3015983 RepID=UPI00273B559E|nr:type I-F CRISPR-associated protein Csy2 [Hahella sp. HNIBRBA332]WLQ14266.1 type I-F CRISPR-associated protein Csy2 [Hahella sp. HNIBRBA332]
MRYVVIPQIEVQRANALATPWCVSLAPVFACTMLGHALGRFLGIQPSAVGVLHIDAQLLAESELPKGYGCYPHQFRGATYIDKKDYSSKNKYAISLQPTASMNLTVSLVLTFNDECPSGSDVERAFQRCRLAGGVIIRHGRISICESLSDDGGVFTLLRSGYWLLDRSAELVAGEQGRVENLLRLVNDSPGLDENKQPIKKRWLSPAVLGYAAITNFSQRKLVRENKLHAFAEPLVGLVEYVTANQVATSSDLFWRGAWTDKDVFTVTALSANQINKGH